MSIVSFRATADISEEAEQIFQIEKALLQKLLPNSDIQHAGSTAIPRSLTKGDVDIVIRSSREDFQNVKEKLLSLFEVNQKENWSEYFASFKDDKSFSLPLGIQLVIKESPTDYFTKVRDALIRDMDLLQEYNDMKKRNNGKDMKTYRKEKAAFFKKILSKTT